MIDKLIRERRAVFPRQFNDKPVEKEEIETILEAGDWAPTHKRTEPWRFKVVQGEKKKALGRFLAERYKVVTEKFSERKYEKIKHKFLRSSCVILICMQRDPKERIPEWEETAATAMAVQNMWLTASTLGIGAYWSSPALRNEVGRFVELEAGECCLGFFYMGYYDTELPEGFRKPLKDKVQWL